MGIYTSRSTDGGLTWGTPVAIPNTAGMISPDKNWIVCDNTATSPFYGNCYTEWDDYGAGNRMEMSRSTDGGLTWSVAATNRAGIIGGQPVVRPDGTVIVPIANANETAIGAFNSTDGGATWRLHRPSQRQASHGRRQPARGPAALGRDRRLRHGLRRLGGLPLPPPCKNNDIVFVKSTNATGTAWSASHPRPDRCDRQRHRTFHSRPRREQGSSGAAAQMGITYYFYAPRHLLAAGRLHLLVPTAAAPGVRASRAHRGIPHNVGRRPPARDGWLATTSRRHMDPITWRMASLPPL